MSNINQNFLKATNITVTADGSTAVNITNVNLSFDKGKTDKLYYGSSSTVPVYGVKTYTGSFSSDQIFSNDISVNEVGLDYFYTAWQNDTSFTAAFKTSKSGSKYFGAVASIDNMSIEFGDGSQPATFTANISLKDVSIYTA